MMSTRCAEILFFVNLLCLLWLPNYCDIKQNDGISQSIQAHKTVSSDPSRIENVPSQQEEAFKVSIDVDIPQESIVQPNVEPVNNKQDGMENAQQSVEQTATSDIPNIDISAEKLKKQAFADLESSRPTVTNEKDFTVTKRKGSPENIGKEGKEGFLQTSDGKNADQVEPLLTSHAESSRKLMPSEKLSDAAATVYSVNLDSTASELLIDTMPKETQFSSTVPSPMDTAKYLSEGNFQQQPQYDGMPSFDEWKKMMLAEQEKDGQKMPSPSPAGKKISSQKRRRNYSSYECGAKIVAANSEAEGTSRILNELVDEYMLNPCKTKIWFVIELCETVQASQIELANFELFSSCPKDFVVYSSDNFPTRDWVLLGNFTAVEQRVLQSFELKQEGFGKFIKIELLSHYGKEHYCPLSVVRIFGTSMVDEYEEMETLASHPDIPDDDLDRLDLPVEDKKSTNIFGSATDAVLNIVKKAAEALGHQTADESQRNDTAADQQNASEAKHYKIVGTEADKCEDVSMKTKADVLVSLQNFSLSPASVHQSLFRLLHRCDQCVSSHIRYYSSAQPHCRFFQAAFGPVLFQALCDWFKEHPLVITHETPIPGKKPHISSEFVISPTKSPPPQIMRIPSESDLSIKEIIINDSFSTISDSDKTVTVNITTVTLDRINNSKLSFDRSKLESSIQPTQTTLDYASTYNDSHKASPGQVSDITTPSSNSMHEYLTKASVPDKTDIPADKDITETVTVSITGSDFTAINELTTTEEEQINELLTDASTAASDDATLSETIAVTEIPSSFKPSEDKQDVRIEYQGKAEPVAVSSGTTAGQKESVFMRMSNRIKALEINMSLSGQYLQELSQRYRRQMEEMQRAFNRTVGTLNDTAKKAAEKDLKQQEILNSLQLQVANLSETVEFLLNERASVFRQMVETHVCLMVIEAIIMITIMSLCVRRISSSVQQVSPLERSVPSPSRLSKRRSSADNGSPHIARKVTKRSNSEDNLNAADVLIVEPLPVLLDPTLKVKKKNRKRNKGIQRSISHPTVEQKCSTSQCTEKYHSHSEGCMLTKIKPKQQSHKESHLCENCNNNSCGASKPAEKEKRLNCSPLQNLTNGSVIGSSVSELSSETSMKGKEKFSFKKFLKFQKRDSI